MSEQHTTEDQDVTGADLAITHTHADGTRIEGTGRGDGSGEVLKACGWRYSPTLGAWYIPRSRDTAAKRDQITQTAARLRDAGFTVAVELNDTPRDLAIVEADRAARSHHRAEALAAKAQRQEAAAERYRADSDRHTARFAGGQPILVDHHSASAALGDQQKGHAAMHRAIETQQQADHTQQRAAAAAAATGARYHPGSVADRIARLEAEQRRVTRQIDGYTRTLYTTTAGEMVTETTPAATGTRAERLWARRDELAAQVAYWRGIRAAQIATGAATSYSRQSITAGDAVKIAGHWYRVVRANAKTVTVAAETGAQKAPYARVQAHRPA